MSSKVNRGLLLGLLLLAALSLTWSLLFTGDPPFNCLKGTKCFVVPQPPPPAPGVSHGQNP
ncbi:hypothetical protein ACJW30_04G169800 [Castanea mollissima]